MAKQDKEPGTKLTAEQIVTDLKRLYDLIPNTIEKYNYQFKMPKYYEEALNNNKYPLFNKHNGKT